MNKTYTLGLYTQDDNSTLHVTHFDNLLDARAVAYAFHLHNEDEGRRWLIIDDVTGEEIPY